MNLNDFTTLLAEFGWQDFTGDFRMCRTRVGPAQIVAVTDGTVGMLRVSGTLPVKFVGFRPLPNGMHTFAMCSTPASALAEILGRIGAYKRTHDDVDAVTGQAWAAQARDGDRWDETTVATVAAQMDREAADGSGWAETVPA